MFEPIAIVGQACVLPGALTPEQLWQSILDQQDLLNSVPKEYWRVDPRSLLNSVYKKEPCWSDKGGYINDFASVFDATGLAIPESRIAGLDPLFQWLLHSARVASNQLKVFPRKRSGFIVGNLCYPSPSFARFAETVWLGEENQKLIKTSMLDGMSVTAENRFMSGLPAHLVAQALALGGESFSLDAACASSLYAIKLACDRLHDHDADAMLVGAANRADDLFLHMGFTALRALSKSGQSRPFHQQADGLVPAEGAACLVLKRLSDALSDNEQVLGIIRAVGLSNDGRSNGFLAPSSKGQIQAMQSAYQQCDISPSSISLIECHATGTPIGDATEITSMREVFNSADDIAIGSLKSNLGHLITVSGLAGIIKLIAAMRTGVRPPSRHTELPIADLQNSGFRLLAKSEPWNTPHPLRAAINSFGFGGNNAHLIIEKYYPETPKKKTVAIKKSKSKSKRQPIAIVGMGGVVNDGRQLSDLVQALYSGKASQLTKQASTINIQLTDVRFPPNDLKNTLPQQLIILNAALEAVQMVKRWPEGLIGTYIGMQCDSEIIRYGMRWRLREWIKTLSLDLEPSLQKGVDSIISSLESAAVVGTMPNMPANRLNSQFDWKGPSFTVASEELSGISSLRIACRALAHKELDVALVGAVDLSCETVHEQAARKILPENLHTPGDAAIALILKRLDDAQRDGDTIFAVIPDQLSKQDFESTLNLTLNNEQNELTRRFGHAHAASGLLHVVVAAIACATRVLPFTKGGNVIPWLPSAKGRQARVSVASFSGQKQEVHLAAFTHHQHLQISDQSQPRINLYSGKDVDEVLQRLQQQQQSNQGPCRLAIVYDNDQVLYDRILRAKQFVKQQKKDKGDLKLDAGIYFRQTPLDGEVGFVFTGAASAYRTSGTELLVAIPELSDSVLQRFPCLAPVIQELYQGETSQPISPFDQLKASSFLCQVHAELSQKVLGLRPHATLGISSGETNALFALDVWRDMTTMFTEIERSYMYEHELAENFCAAKKAWGLTEDTIVNWSNWRILADKCSINQALKMEPRVSLLIINSPNDCIIGGEIAACRRVIEVIGKRKAHPLGQDMIVHCQELDPFASEWLRIHHRKTIAPHKIRFYSNAIGTHYSLTSASIAENLTLQASQCIDFPRTVNNAWQDGVRVFIEHGPRNSLTESIHSILNNRDHLAISLDAPSSSNSIQHLFEAVAQLIVAGVPVDYQKLESKFVRGSDSAFHSLFTAVEKKPVLELPAHPPLISISLKKPTQAKSKQGYMIPAPPVAILFNDRSIQPHFKTQWQKMLPPPGYTPNLKFIKTKPSSSKVSVELKTTRLLKASSSTAKIIDLFSEISEIHQNYLLKQSSLQQQYMSLQERIWDLGLVSSKQSKYPDSTFESTTKNTSLIHEFSKAEAKPEASITLTASESKLSQQTKQLPIKKINDAHTLPQGSSFSKAQLEALASGKISIVLGTAFCQQDHYKRQVRLPEPPLLLVDRVTGIDAEAGTMGLGTIWTETDIAEDSWYLHHGVMPPGILIESGQADLLLISWLGADFQNRDQRVYRLLGCELTFHPGGLPKPGDTLCYDIHVDSHARSNQTNLFFFHYDCRINDQLKLSVTNGQAGFFTDQELAESKGVLWDPASDHPKQGVQLDPPPCCSSRNVFSEELIQFWCQGDAFSCFGKGFEQAATHHRTPSIASGKMCLIDKVKYFDPDGGPWGRGYMKAETKVYADNWFFKGHFKNDPCMPGTLMAEASIQIMSLYMTAIGCTLQRDYWRFEPVADERFKFVCRGQVTPESKQLIYEIFVEEFIADPIPTLFVAVLCSADGLNVFHCRRFGIRMVPDWPLNAKPNASSVATAIVGEHSDVRGDYDALLACAWGLPSSAFGTMYEKFDAGGRVPRLPGPPYHFMSKIIDLEGRPGVVQIGAKMHVEYHIPHDAWYFKENSAEVMPFCVLLEAMLQPCGWMASYLGVTAASDDTLAFRNLDGQQAEQSMLITPDSGTLLTEVTLTDISRLGPMTLVFFRAECKIKQQSVLKFTTSFGFFNAEALHNQVGLPVSSEHKQQLHQASEFYCDLRLRPAHLFLEHLKLPDSKLLMLDEITGYWSDGGSAGLGKIRGNQFIDPQAWYFKAHFFQDPVQPGSLGMEALIQLLQCFAIEKGLHKDFKQPYFEAMALEQAFEWKYRGQVLATNKNVTTVIEVKQIQNRTGEILISARGDLWVDELRIYTLESFSIRIVERQALGSQVETLDSQIATWLLDHRPTWTIPTLPLMSMADRLVDAVTLNNPGAITRILNLQVHRWLTLSGPTQIKTEIKQVDAGQFDVKLLVWRQASNAQLSRYEITASATVVIGGSVEPPVAVALPQLQQSKPAQDPYTNGRLFHGPAFQLMTELHMGLAGSSALLDAEIQQIPLGTLNQGLLDAATHTIPHDRLHIWDASISKDQVAYPFGIIDAVFFGAPPSSGKVRCETRLIGFHKEPRFPLFHIQLSYQNRIFCDIKLVEILLPKGPLGDVSALKRLAFVRDLKPVPNMSLSQIEGDVTRLSLADIKISDWLPGTVAKIYRAQEPLLEVVAIKDHIAKKTNTHPSDISVTGNSAFATKQPLTLYSVNISRDNDAVTISDQCLPRVDTSQVAEYWRKQLNIGAWPMEDLYLSLIRRFVGQVHIIDPKALEPLKGKPVLFLANHQVAIESLLFGVLSSSLLQIPTALVAKSEHQASWLGRLIQHGFSYPGIEDPGMIHFFNRDDPAAFPAVINGIIDHRSLMVHIEGTRSLCCGNPVTTLSSVLLDLAIKRQLPIVPVRFSNGLPRQKQPERLDFPYLMGRQDYFIGKPILPEEIAALAYKERRDFVLAAMNEVGPAIAQEQPSLGDTEFFQRVQARQNKMGISQVNAVFIEAFEDVSEPSLMTTKLLKTIVKTSIELGTDPTDNWLRTLMHQLLTPIN